ncbi:hypothetical protein ACROYT_G012658 [Oculina patagonica]
MYHVPLTRARPKEHTDTVWTRTIKQLQPRYRLKLSLCCEEAIMKLHLFSIALLIFLTAYHCNGQSQCAQGPPGSPGTPGTSGTPGTPGTPGRHQELREAPDDGSSVLGIMMVQRMAGTVDKYMNVILSS